MYELLGPCGRLVLMIMTKTNLFECIDHLKKQADWNKFSLVLDLVIPDWKAASPDADHHQHFRRILEGLGFRVGQSDAVRSSFMFAWKAACAEFFISQNPVAHESKMTLYDDSDEACKTFYWHLSVSAGRSGPLKPSPYEIQYELVNFVVEKPASAEKK